MLGLLVIAPILMAILSVIFRSKKMKRVIILFQLLMVGVSFYLFMVVKETGTLLLNFGNIPDGIGISLYADALSIFVVLITTVFYLFFLIYTLNEEYGEPRFYFLFLVLQGLMMGLFLSSDLFNIFIFLEVSTVVVSILIMYNKDKQVIYDGMIYFFVNVIGTSFLLFGTGLLYRTFGLLDIRKLTESMSLLESPSAIILPLGLMAVTISLKTAVIPLFSWLPRAHGTPSAPPVVSAILSGLYIKSGVYLFIRVTNMFSSVIDLSHFFLWVGFFTALIGAIMALAQDDIKLMLAYSTVSQIGLIMIGLNIGSEISFWGALYHIFSHAIFKSTLFLTAGLIIKEYRTRNVHKIKGLFQRMPIVASATMLSILGITGAPFFNGSISKYLIAQGTNDVVITFLINVISFGTILYYIKYGSMFLKDNQTVRKEKLDKYAIGASSAMGIIALISGVFGVELLNFFFNYQAQISFGGYVEKSFVYLSMVLVCIGLYYKVIIKNEAILSRIGHIELTFNAIITSMVGYFILLVLYINYLV